MFLINGMRTYYWREKIRNEAWGTISGGNELFVPIYWDPVNPQNGFSTFPISKSCIWHCCWAKHLSCAGWLQSSPPTARTYFPPLNFKSIQHFQNFFICHMSPPRYPLGHNSVPKFRRYIKTLPSGPRWRLLPFFGSKARRLTEAVLG